MASPSQIVIAPDGTVLAASGPLATGLVDARLEDCTRLSPVIRAVGTTLLNQLRVSGNRIVSQTVELDGDEASVDVVAIEALAIRRTAADLRDLLTSKLAVISSQAEAAGVSVNVTIADDVPATVSLDAEKMAWAVTTLVGNALRYVQTPSRRLGGKAIDVRANFDAASSEVTIAVQDDGPGIPGSGSVRILRAAQPGLRHPALLPENDSAWIPSSGSPTAIARSDRR
jgi:signal transduction histidine kinase